jgi:hypothetical protein
MKIFVPGFGAIITDENNLTFNADLLMKFRVEKRTRHIELNSLKLFFYHQNLEKYQLNRVDEINENITMSKSLIKVVEIRVDETREKVYFFYFGYKTKIITGRPFLVGNRSLDRKSITYFVYNKN